MNVFEAVKPNITTRQAAEMYGIKVNRHGMAVCPFHNDKNPSMKVDKRFHCFACQADGDAVDFVSRLFGLPSKEAAMKLADDFGIATTANANRQSSPTSGSLLPSSFIKKRKHDVSECCPIIFIFCEDGRPNTHRKRRMTNGIRCLWKPCKE